MIKLCVSGACGRMGRRIIELAAAEPEFEIAGALDLPALAGAELVISAADKKTLRVSADKGAALEPADVLIDFTQADGCVETVRAAATAGKAAVVGTTGLNAQQQAELAELARLVPIVHAPNMSIGVNLLFKLTREVARTLGPAYAVEIVEAHHDRKKDSPSGTAFRLAECAAEPLEIDVDRDVVHGRQGLVGERPTRQIGMHAVRGGDIVGEHTVYFIGHGERLELTHRAHSRDNFARGALRAARFAVTARPALYDMQDVLGLK